MNLSLYFVDMVSGLHHFVGAQYIDTATNCYPIDYTFGICSFDFDLVSARKRQFLRFDVLSSKHYYGALVTF